MHHGLSTVARSLHKKDLHEPVCSVHRILRRRKHACTPSHHSIIPSRSGFRLRTCNLIHNFGATGVYAGVFCARVFVSVYKTEGGGQTGIIRVRKIKALAARPSHRLNSMER